MLPVWKKTLIWSTKRWQYFTEHVAASVEVGDYQQPLQHWFIASSVWIEKKKKKVLWDLVKEYLRSILSFHSLIHLNMSLFNIYISPLDWIPLLAFSSSVCLKDKRVSCNVDEVIYCIRVNLFVRTDGVISCVLSLLSGISANMTCQFCFYQTRLSSAIKIKCFILLNTGCTIFWKYIFYKTDL